MKFASGGCKNQRVCPRGGASMGLRGTPSPSHHTPRNSYGSSLTCTVMEQWSRQRSIGSDPRDGWLRGCSRGLRGNTETPGCDWSGYGASSSPRGSASLRALAHRLLKPSMVNRRNDATTMDGAGRLVSRTRCVQSEETSSTRPSDVTARARGPSDASGPSDARGSGTRRTRSQRSAGNTDGSAPWRGRRGASARRG